MGKNKGGRKQQAGGDDGDNRGDQRARNKVDHRGGGRRGDNRDDGAQVPQELIEKAAKLGCEVWQIEEFEAR